MLDRAIQHGLRPLFTRVARHLVRLGIGADALSFTGFALGIAAAICIAFSQFHAGLALLLISRLMDGLDGAVARATAPTDRGGFLDITLDFLFYAAIPLGFAFADPAANALPAAVLLASFVGTGSSFLAFAALAAQRGLQDSALPGKSFYFLGGLTEATETITAFALMCLFPAWFPVIAWVFAGLCALTTVTRLVWGWQRLR